MKISREELYDRVWSTPISRLAKEFDISDVGLSKSCRKNGIPTPPVGYWAKRAHGKAPPRPPLPPSDIKEVVLEAALFRASTTTLKRAASLTAIPPIQVQPPTRPLSEVELAPVTAATHAALVKRKPNEYGFVASDASNTFRCSLSPATVERAVKMLDALERGLKASGIQIKQDRETRRVVLIAEGEQIGISLLEGYTRQDTVHVDPKYSWSKTHVYSYTFDGRLQLKLEGNYEGRKSWGDGSRERLENKLVDVVAGVTAAGLAIKARKDYWAEQHRKWAEAEKQRQAAAEKARRIKEFRDRFVAEAAAWTQHQQAADYLSRLKASLPVDLKGLSPESIAWLDEAERAVHALDPSASRLTKLLATPLPIDAEPRDRA
jgi:hypothetical protein